MQEIRKRKTTSVDLSVARFYEQHGAKDLAEQVKKKVAAARGEDDPNHGKVPPRVERSIADEIDVDAIDTSPESQPAEAKPASGAEPTPSPVAASQAPVQPESSDTRPTGKQRRRKATE